MTRGGTVGVASLHRVKMPGNSVWSAESSRTCVSRVSECAGFKRSMYRRSEKCTNRTKYEAILGGRFGPLGRKPHCGDYSHLTKRAMGLKTCAIYWLDPKGETLRLVEVATDIEDEISIEPITVGAGCSGRCRRDGTSGDPVQAATGLGRSLVLRGAARGSRVRSAAHHGRWQRARCSRRRSFRRAPIRDHRAGDTRCRRSAGIASRSQRARVRHAREEQGRTREIVLR